MAKTEVHNAIVTRNIDPALGSALRGSVFFNAPTLFEGEFPLPAAPCFPFASDKGAGIFFVPQVGDEIEVVILSDDGSFDTSDVELPEPRWRCMLYSDAADIAEEFQSNYTKTMGWKTNSGHILLFDDTEGEEFLRLAHKIGTILEIDKEGSWFETIVKDKIAEIAENFTINVGKDLTITVMENKSVTVTKNISTDVTEEETHSVGKNLSVTVGENWDVQVTGDASIQCENANVNANSNVDVQAGGDAKITAGGKVEEAGSTIEMNGSGGSVVTTGSDPLVDNITGAPHIGVPTVLAG